MDFDKFQVRKERGKRNRIENWAMNVLKATERMARGGDIGDAAAREVQVFITQMAEDLLAVLEEADPNQPQTSARYYLEERASELREAIAAEESLIDERDEDTSMRYHNEAQAAQLLYDESESRLANQALDVLDPELRHVLKLYHYAGIESASEADLGMPPAVYNARLIEAHVMLALIVEVGPERFQRPAPGHVFGA